MRNGFAHLYFISIKKKFFYFEHIYGFLEIDYENDLTFNQKIDRFFLDFASKIENKYLQIAEANLTQRVKGIYNSASLFHTKRKNLEKRNYYRFNQIRNNALFLFNHAFADASNKKYLIDIHLHHIMKWHYM